MDEFEIVRHLMLKDDVTVTELSNKLGYKAPSGLSKRLDGKHIYVDTWKKILDALDCEIVVREKSDDKKEYPLIYDGFPSPLRFEGMTLDFDKILG